jgi:hypothetical protein
MKIFDKVIEIFNQYNLKPIVLPEEHNNIYSFLKTYPEFKKDFETEKDDFYFINKYSKNIGKGYYGFSIGTPIVPEWNEIIEKILDVCINTDPDFEIHQIKLKFGGIRFYVYTNIIEDIDDVEMLVMKKMYDNALIY